MRKLGRKPKYQVVPAEEFLKAVAEADGVGAEAARILKISYVEFFSSMKYHRRQGVEFELKGNKQGRPRVLPAKEPPQAHQARDPFDYLPKDYDRFKEFDHWNNRDWY